MHGKSKFKYLFKFDVIVLLPNSEVTKGNKKCNHTVGLRPKTMSDRLFKLPITLLFVVRNIKCGYSFS